MHQSQFCPAGPNCDLHLDNIAKRLELLKVLTLKHVR